MGNNPILIINGSSNNPNITTAHLLLLPKNKAINIINLTLVAKFNMSKTTL